MRWSHTGTELTPPWLTRPPPPPPPPLLLLLPSLLHSTLLTATCAQNAGADADVDPGLSRREILVRYAAYAETVVAADPKALGRVLKPLVWLFAGEKKNRNWRQALETERRAGTDVVSIITKSMTELDDEVLDAL